MQGVYLAQEQKFFRQNSLNQLVNTSPAHVPKVAFYRDIVGMCIKFWDFPEPITIFLVPVTYTQRVGHHN